LFKFPSITTSGERHPCAMSAQTITDAPPQTGSRYRTQHSDKTLISSTVDSISTVS